MKLAFQKRTLFIKLFEFSILLILIGFFLSKLYWHLSVEIHLKPKILDIWHQCYILECQTTRILGLNPGGLWEGNTFYPFNTVSLLFDEPSWGVSLLVASVRMLTKNIYPIYRLGSIVALFLSWIFTYYFVKDLGGRKIWSFFAGAAFCLSGINVALTVDAYCFWPFFFIPLLGIITKKIFSTSRLYWGVLWGIIFGYLAWSSAHLFVMGCLFLCLFVLWNLIFNNHSKNTLLSLLTGIIAAAVFGPMYFTYKEFLFYRSYYDFWQHSSNWANLIFRRWPPLPFNPIVKTQLWEYLKTHAKGETNIGMSFLLLFSALIIFITRLKKSIYSPVVRKFSKYTFIIVVIASILFAFLNMYSLTARCMQLKVPLPNLATGLTYLYYVTAGIIIFVLRNRIRSAIKHLDFFLLLSAILFGFLAFGPYYLTSDKLVIASPIAFLQYHVLGLSGIKATARWGLILSFTLSVAVALFLSNYAKSRKLKICAVIFIFIVFLELSPGFQIPEIKKLSPYQWTPRETDIFLKNIPDHGAVLELSSYPLKQEHELISDNSLGYILFSGLYHKKPHVAGYGLGPHVTNRYLRFPESTTLSAETIGKLRKFGARYWVFHIDGWPKEEVRLLKNSVGTLKQIAELDSGKTLIYEDPDPMASVGYFDII